MLPAIAVLHVRHAPVRQSGAILATIAGTTTVAVGLAASVVPELRPAALVVMAVWWWTAGKMWIETAVMPRALGIVTAGLGAIALVASPYAALRGSIFFAGTTPAGPGWTTVHLLIAAWLIALAAALAWRPAVPSR
jgi:hypothetical protein